MVADYLTECLKFTFRRSVLAVDSAQIVLASFVPLAFQLLGAKMPEGTAASVLAYIGYAAIAFLIIRFLTSPYFLWREQRLHIAALEGDIAKPEQMEKGRIAEHLGDLRAKLAQELGMIGAEARRYEPVNQSRTRTLPINEAEELINQISYDEELRSMCTDYLQSCFILLDARHNHEDDRQIRVDLDNLGKKVFRALHRA